MGADRVTASSHLGCSMTPASTRARVRTSIRRSVLESCDVEAAMQTGDDNTLPFYISQCEQRIDPTFSRDFAGPRDQVIK